MDEASQPLVDQRTENDRVSLGAWLSVEHSSGHSSQVSRHSGAGGEDFTIILGYRVSSRSD